MGGQLRGAQVLVPRAASQADSMRRHLESLGAQVLCVPTIAFEAPKDPRPMAEAICKLADGAYAWTVFTSTNAVEAFFAAGGVLDRTRVAAVGTKTAKKLTDLGVTVELTPARTKQNAAGLVEVFPLFDAAKDSTNEVLLPRADIASDVLPTGLTAAGWAPDDVVAYRTVSAPTPPSEVCDQITGGGVDAICFTSGSTVRNLLSMVGKPAPGTVIACIGPMAAEQAKACGLDVHVMPDHATARDLVEALAQHYTERSQQK